MKKLLLILVILVGFILLSGCCCNFCGGYVTPPQLKCSVTVVALDPIIWGTVHYCVISTGKIVNTGKYLNYSTGQREITIYNLQCWEEIWIYLIDACNYSSHVEPVIPEPGQNNNAYFYYY